MRRRLTTPDTWNIIAAFIAVILIVGGATWYWNNGRTSSQEAFVVKSHGKILVTTGEWATVQANSAARERQFPGYLVTIDSIVMNKLEYAEAEKRGTVCTTEEATTKAKEGIAASLTSDNGRKLALSSVGVYVPGYSLTPEAARTPALADGMATVAADPEYIETYRQGCSIGRLFTSLSPGPDAGARNEAISALQSKLRIDAALEYGSAATPTPTATP